MPDGDLWCWHCCHPFPGDPVRFPIRYDERLDKWTVSGYFCSWGCAKRWNVDRVGGGGCDTGLRECLLPLFRKKCTGEPIRTGIVPAPPRQVLKVFGGTMTIEEFRKEDNVVVVLPEHMVELERVVSCWEAEAAKRKARPGPDMEQPLKLGAPKTRNESMRLKLKRAKPTPTDPDALARAMGLIIE